MRSLLIFLSVALLALTAFAAPATVDPATKQALTIDYKDYYANAVKIQKFRDEHLLDVPALLKLMDEQHPVIVDVRSRDSYEKQHLKGAVNLSLADITSPNLAKIIPTKETPIVLYCDMSLDINPSRMIAASSMAYPAFYTHGYHNLYELKDLWKTKDREEQYKLIPFESKPKP